MIGGLVRAGAAAGEAAISRVPGGLVDLSQAGVIAQTDNRPWPVPGEPWVMAQTWRDLLFAHWPVDPGALARVLPPGLEPDTFEGRAWVGVTPFEVSGLRPRGGLPVPRLSRFPELNVRTYMTLEDKPGIFFLSLDAGSLLAVLGARRAYRLPYFRARMSIVREDGTIHYESDRSSPDGEPAAFAADYRPTGQVFHAAAGTLEYFLTERYCLYTLDDARRPLRADIQHPPWPLQIAGATIRRNTMTRPWGIRLPDEPPLLHYSHMQQVLIWPLRVVGEER